MDEEIQSSRDLFWIVIFVGFLINVVASIFIGILGRTMYNLCALLFASLFIVLIFSIKFKLWQPSIYKKDYELRLVYDKEQDNYILESGYLPSEITHFGLKNMKSKNPDFTYNSDLSDINNDFAEYLFHYIILYMLNRMHTIYLKTKRKYVPRIIEDNKDMFEDLNPMDIDCFKSNPFIKDDIWITGTRIRIVKGTIFNVGRENKIIRTLILSNQGIELTLAFMPASMNSDIFRVSAYSSLISCEVKLSKLAKLRLIIFEFFYESRLSIFYKWCMEVMVRAEDIHWDVFEEKNSERLDKTL